jgi:hypothetical protein
LARSQLTLKLDGPKESIWDLAWRTFSKVLSSSKVSYSGMLLESTLQLSSHVGVLLTL